MSDQQDAPASEPEDDKARAQPWPIDPADEPNDGAPGHLAPDDIGPREWVDASKDPTPGYPGHAAPEDDAPA